MPSIKKSKVSEVVLTKKLNKLMIELDEEGYDQEFIYKLLKPYVENKIAHKKEHKKTASQFSREMLAKFHNHFYVTPNVALVSYFKNNIRDEFGDEYSFTYLNYLIDTQLDSYYHNLTSEEHKCNFIITKLRDCKQSYKRRVSDMESELRVFQAREERKKQYDNMEG